MCLEPVQLVPQPRGALTNLVPTAITAHPPAPNNITLRVCAVGLNFRDVLNVLGMYPGDPGPPGSDCAGIVLAAAPNTGHTVGDVVFGQASGCLGTAVEVDHRAMVRLPPGVGCEEGSTLPTVFLTALACLNLAAGVGAGGMVLVHAASGTFGLVVEHRHYLASSQAAN
jgi:NADPH:quinone reductase-like Zn-dependent oxidoreductase